MGSRKFRHKSTDEVNESFENEIGFLEGRYSVKLPWKLGHDPLPRNFANSVSRMKGQLKRLKREPEVLNEYDSIVKEQLSSGVIEKGSELEEPGGNVHYIYLTKQLFVGMQRPRN